jgi:hypothetical protein
MIQRFATLAGSLYKYAQVCQYFMLTGKIFK